MKHGNLKTYFIVDWTTVFTVQPHISKINSLDSEGIIVIFMAPISHYQIDQVRSIFF